MPPATMSTRERWPLTLVVSTLCCVPLALLVFAGAPRRLVEVLLQPEDMEIPLLFAVSLAILHAVALVLVLFAVAGYVRWSRRARETRESGSARKDRMVRADASWAGHARSWQAAATGHADQRQAPGGGTVAARALSNRPLGFPRRRSSLARSEGGSGIAIVDEQGLQEFLRAERQRKEEREHLPQHDFPIAPFASPAPNFPSQTTGLNSTAPPVALPYSGMSSPQAAFSPTAAMVVVPRYGSYIGAGLTSTSPFMSSPMASPLPLEADGSPYSAAQAKRRLSSTGADGSGKKYQRALYDPKLSDTQEDPGAIARQASDLLLLLHIDSQAGVPFLPSWRDNLRLCA
mmetsp:Transcript_47016/g.123378  ORF Transcript_47016/g.123378 Transcript_47016/m.123378 type:complete len:346 (-) Transcript_47016:3028-4065(-)